MPGPAHARLFAYLRYDDAAAGLAWLTAVGFEIILHVALHGASGDAEQLGHRPGAPELLDEVAHLGARGHPRPVTIHHLPPGATPDWFVDRAQTHATADAPWAPPPALGVVHAGAGDRGVRAGGEGSRGRASRLVSALSTASRESSSQAVMGRP